MPHTEESHQAHNYGQSTCFPLNRSQFNPNDWHAYTKTFFKATYKIHIAERSTQHENATEIPQ